ncbi:hypothetical protein PtA15_6A634 [Puccinia triticina]|uniref:Uncharacterized protein n=1 Tax=Puccinia triticina TaxID=208348 RepID=A0ABY7CMV3_9BASI|nr:uncharacterized protein PtA15_6A634 [Puccinia triticina]WAQ86004.1 hypothetical protein PtA15_6A634 [Puccinia triticina]
MSRPIGFFDLHPEYTSSKDSVFEFKTMFYAMRPAQQIRHMNQALICLLQPAISTPPDDLLLWCEVLSEVVNPDSEFKRINVAILYAFHTFILQNYKVEIVKSTIMKRVKKTMLKLRGEQDTEFQWAQELYHPEKGLSEPFKDKKKFRKMWEKDETQKHISPD